MMRHDDALLEVLHLSGVAAEIRTHLSAGLAAAQDDGAEREVVIDTAVRAVALTTSPGSLGRLAAVGALHWAARRRS